MTDWPELYKIAPTYAKLTPPRVLSARERAEKLYREFDALVDNQAPRAEIDKAYKAYQQADDEYMSIKHAYLADPTPKIGSAHQRRWLCHRR